MVLAISQASCLCRAQKYIDSPLFLGMDTHAPSAQTLATALEALAANGMAVPVEAARILWRADSIAESSLFVP